MTDNEQASENNQPEQQSNQTTTTSTIQQHIDILRDTNANVEMEKKSFNLDSSSLEKKLEIISKLKSKETE